VCGAQQGCCTAAFSACWYLAESLASPEAMCALPPFRCHPEATRDPTQLTHAAAAQSCACSLPCVTASMLTCSCPLHHRFLLEALQLLQRHETSWCFRTPVSLQDAPDYYDVIKDPMDLSTMEKRLATG
jgi:hypothetical protein